MKKGAVVLFLVMLVLVVLVGAAAAIEMSGTVSAVNAEKGMITLKNENMDVGFDCETGSLIRDVKVGDEVTIQYEETNGKKKVTNVSPLKKRAPVGC